jgi:hypothetical protein
MIKGLNPIAMLLSLSLAGCSKTVDVVFQQQIVPQSLLDCPVEPRPGAIFTESQLLDYFEEVRAAGNACRVNLDAVRQYLQQKNKDSTAK